MRYFRKRTDSINSVRDSQLNPGTSDGCTGYAPAIALLTRRQILLAVASGTTLFPAVAQGQLQAEVVSLRNGGFWPTTIRRSGGKFLLVITNRSDDHAMVVEVKDRDNGASVVAPGRVRSPHQDLLLNLKPGTYTVKNADRENWKPLTIIIE